MSETFNREKLRAELVRDEGRRQYPYRDTVGKLTIGCGWNLDDNGLPDDVIDVLLDRAIDHAVQAVEAIEPRWQGLTPERQRVLVNMAFNLGPLKLALFKKFWAAVGEYLSGGDASALDRAAGHMLDSLWAKQVGARAHRLAYMMRSHQG